MGGRGWRRAAGVCGRDRRRHRVIARPCFDDCVITTRSSPPELHNCLSPFLPVIPHSCIPAISARRRAGVGRGEKALFGAPHATDRSFPEEAVDVRFVQIVGSRRGRGLRARASAARRRPAPQLPSAYTTPGATPKATTKEVCAADYATSVKPVAAWQRNTALERYGIR